MGKLFRTIISALALAWAAGLAAQTTGGRVPGIYYDDRGSPQAIEPFLRVLPMEPVDIDGLNRSVIMIFSVECNFSQSMHQRIAMWGQTLPEGWSFIPLHIVGPGYSGPGPVAAAARAAAKWHGGEFWEAEYWEMMYEAVQGGLVSTEDIAAAIKIAELAGTSESLVRQAFGTEGVVTAIQQMASLMMRYRPDRVPTIVVGDRYMTHPDLVGSDPMDTLRVVNALVAMVISEQHEQTEEGENSQ